MLKPPQRFSHATPEILSRKMVFESAFGDYARTDAVRRIMQGYGVPAAVAPSASEATPSEYARLVLQRADAVRLLVQADSPEEEWVGTGLALIVYVSFTGDLEKSGAAQQKKTIEDAAKAVLNLPVLTRGQWGDGARTESALDLAMASPEQAGAVSVVIIPQASLSVKAKPGGKGVSYRALASKEAGEGLFDAFRDAVAAVAAQALHKGSGAGAAGGGGGGGGSGGGGGGGGGGHDAHLQEIQRKRAAALIPPEELFLTGEHAGLYSAFDARGVPTRDASGAELAKNALKKCE